VLFTTQLGWIGGLDDKIAATCREAAFATRELGWQVEERDLAWPDPAPFGDIISGVGLASRVGPFRDRHDDIEPGILAILERVDKLPAHAFYDAYFERNRWCAHPLSLFEEFDLLITPATASLPFALGQPAPATINGGPLPSSGWSPYLRAFNLTGQPAISLPAGRSKNGLPIGLQMVGRRFADDALLSAAAAFERLRPWPRWKPQDCRQLVKTA
jgi:aspartyl-tRNA(Asn)/glutamyl-tRNA(Gln) amidotransferase subunit A